MVMPDSILGPLIYASPKTALRLATPADQPFLQNLFVDDRAPLFAAFGADMSAMLLEQQYRAQCATYAVIAPNAANFIILRDGAPAGRLLVDWQAEGKLRIVDFVLMTASRRQGIGLDSLTALANAARAAGASCLALSVSFSNIAAQNLYEKLGFVAMARQNSDINIAMEWHL